MLRYFAIVIVRLFVLQLITPVLLLVSYCICSVTLPLFPVILRYVRYVRLRVPVAFYYAVRYRWIHSMVFVISFLSFVARCSSYVAPFHVAHVVRWFVGYVVIAIVPHCWLIVVG